VSGDSLLHALLELQTDFLRGGDPQRPLERWLTLLLEETGGEHGLLGVERPTPGAAPQLQSLASTPPGWVDACWEVPTWRTPGGSEPLSLRALADMSLSAGQPVSAEGAVMAPASAPLPAGPSLPRSCRVLPLHAGDARVGFVGFTLRPGVTTSMGLRRT
jgi:hypothetical protein